MSPKNDGKGKLGRELLDEFARLTSVERLQNKYLGEEEGWGLYTEDKSHKPFRVAVVSDMTTHGKAGPKIGPKTAWQHLLEGQRVQNNSYLEEQQRLAALDAREVLQDPTERYAWVIGEANGEGVGFASVGFSRFSDTTPYINMFFRPTIRSDIKGLAQAKVVSKDGAEKPLEQLIWEESLKHLKGTGLMVVSDAPERQLAHAEKYGFRALVPQFDVPDLRAKKKEQYSQVADRVFLGIISPDEYKVSFPHGMPLEKSFELFNSFIREGYIDEAAKVNARGETKVTAVQGAKKMYDDNINRLIDAAVKAGETTIVPYKDINPSDYDRLGLRPLAEAEKVSLKERYLTEGNQAFARYRKWMLPQAKVAPTNR